MANNPLDLIKKGAVNILKGTGDFFADQNAGGIAKNTILGIPKAANDIFMGKTDGFDASRGTVYNTIAGLAPAAKQLLIPTYGYSQEEINAARPTTKQKLLGVPKAGAAIVTGFGSLLNAIPGYNELAYRATNNRVGNILADAGSNIIKFGVPQNAAEAKAMQFADVASNFIPGGVIAKDARTIQTIAKISKAEDAAMFARKIGVADDLIPTATQAFLKAKTPEQAQKALDSLINLQSNSTIYRTARSTPKTAEEAAETYFKGKIQPDIEQGRATIIGADDLKDFFNKDYNDANHPIYSKASFQLYQRALKENPDPVVKLTGGGPGSGKTELVVNNLSKNFKGTIYDSNFSSYDGALNQIKAAREAGKQVLVFGILPDISKAREFTMARAAETGRTISDKTFVRGHTGFPATVTRLIEDGVLEAKDVKLLDTRGITNKATFINKVKKGEYIDNPLETLRSLGYNETNVGQISKSVRESREVGSTRVAEPARPLNQDRPIAGERESIPRGDSASAGQSPIDELINQGRVRVVSVNGRDVYQYKVGDEWRNARNEDTVVSRLTRPVTVKKVESKEIEDLKAQIAVYQDALDLDPAADLIKYYGTKDPHFENLDDIFAKNVGKNRPAHWLPRNKLDDIVGERGFNDVQEAHEAVLDYLRHKETLKDMRATLARKRVEAKEAGAATKSPLQSVATAKARPIQGEVGEVRSIELAGEQAKAIADSRYLDEVEPLRAIVEKNARDVKEKVNLLDFIRTPDRVMAKIGFAKEARQLRNAYEDYVIELPKNIEKIRGWADSVPEKGANERIFRYLDGEAITLNAKEMKVATEIKAWLKGWADRLGLPEDKQISHYITHIFDKELIAKEFDEDLAKIIADKIPGSVYDPFLQKRLGAKGYRQDTWDALDAYVKRGTRKAHLDPVLDSIKSKAGTSLDVSPLEESQFKYLQKYLNNVNMRPSTLDNLFDNTIKSVVGYRFGQRPLTYILSVLRRATYRGMLGLNPGSALRNLSQGINTYAILGEKYTAIGYAKLFNRGAMEELKAQGVLADSFIQDRVLSSTRKAIQAADKGLFYFFQGAERINRGSAYFGAKSKGIAEGMTEAQAIEYAKSVVRKTQFAFDSVDTPVVLQGDLVKSVAQFQTFTVKQIEFLAELAKDKNYAGLLRYAAAGTAFVYTIGQAIDMEPKQLIPWFRFDVPPSLKFPWEVGKAVADAPDKYGQPRDLETKAKDVFKSSLGLIPGGIQMKKTYEGIQAVNEGGSFDKSGKLQFEVGATTADKVQAILFGKYSSAGADAYFDKLNGGLTDAQKKIVPVYEKVQSLKAQGKNDEAVAMFNDLSDADKVVYKAYRSKVIAQQTLAGKKAILPTFQKIRAQKESGDVEGAIKAYDALSEDQKKYYQLVKKQIEKDGKAAEGEIPKYEDGEPQTAQGLVSTVFTYAQAIGTDPITAFNRIFTGQRIRYVAGGAIVVERLPMEKSQDIKEERGGKDASMKLDHTIPLQLGGSNSESNLSLVPTAVWETYTPVENALGKALRDNKITKSKAQELIQAFKTGKLTANQVLEQIK